MPVCPMWSLEHVGATWRGMGCVGIPKVNNPVPARGETSQIGIIISTHVFRSPRLPRARLGDSPFHRSFHDVYTGSGKTYGADQGTHRRRDEPRAYLSYIFDTSAEVSCQVRKIYSFLTRQEKEISAKRPPPANRCRQTLLVTVTACSNGLA